MPVTNYVWDPVDDNVVLETDNTNATTATYTNEPGRYGGLISQRRGSTDSYYHYDGLGSTRELTDDSETVTDTNLYDAWGVNVDSSGTTENPYRWVGRSGYYYDSETSDYYVRRRVYSPTIGRWWSVDPLGFRGGWNLYSYSRNYPIIFTDPSGLVPKGPCGSCSPTPKDHSVYRPRGKFPTLTLGPRRNTGGIFSRDRDRPWEHRVGSTFELTWSPSEIDGSSMFFSGGYPGQKGYCCCCDLVGLVQIVRVKYLKPKTLTPWKIDAGIPYPHSLQEGPATVDPCPDPKNNMAIGTATLGDRPNFNQNFLDPLLYNQDLETCAVCLKGVEGPKAKKYFTIYGCVKWGHELFRDAALTTAERPGYKNVSEGRIEVAYDVTERYIETASGLHRMDRKTKEVFLVNQDGIEPSANFKGLIERYY